jgi:hypothetical protein
MSVPSGEVSTTITGLSPRCFHAKHITFSLRPGHAANHSHRTFTFLEDLPKAFWVACASAER